MNKGIILLSGGLDSTVSMASLLNSTKFELALTFDYGQKSVKKKQQLHTNWHAITE